MTQSELEQFRLKIKQDYVKLLNLLALVMRASSPPSTTDGEDRERLLIAQGLSNNFIEHAVTILYLSHGTKQDLPLFKFNFFDSASIDVLTRTAFEAFLTFHYVFYEPKTKEERDYRYWCYKAAGISERQNARVSTDEHRQKQAAEKKELDEVHEKLKLSAVFQSLTNNQKKQILKGEWRLKSWRELAVSAGLSETLASDVYRFLSGRVHSSSLSVVQMIGDHIDVEDEKVISSSMGTINAVIANMIKEYCGLFPGAQKILDADRGGREIVGWWIQIDRTLDEFNK